MEPDKSADQTHTGSEWLAGLNRAILDSALDCIITMDAAGRVVEFNPAAEKVFGYSRAETVGKELAELIIPPPLRERHRRGLQQYLKTGKGPVLGRRIEISAVRADGTEFLVELAITAFRLKKQPVFTAYLRDITERVRTEQRRLAQYNVASLLAGSWSITEAGTQILQTIAASGNWVFASLWLTNDEEDSQCAATWHAEGPQLERFEQITRDLRMASGAGLPGRVRQTKKPTWIADVTREESFPRVDAAREAGLRGAFAFPLCAGAEMKGVIELFATDLVQPDADLLQLVEALGSQIGLFIHRRKIEQELQHQKETAVAANAAKDRFLATLSHELRTPLTPVLIWAGGTVQTPGLQPEIRKGLQMICRNIELEARLIDDMLDLTRISRGKLNLHLRPTDLHELVGHAIEILRDDLDSRPLTLDVHFDATAHHIMADGARMQQVFWNVLRNAYKFTPNHGVVSVRSFNPAHDRLGIEISDTGVGIEPHDLSRIFEAFEQVGSRPEGLGLGLAISKAIVEMHGGNIGASSAGSGKGASFTIQFPTTNDRS